MALLAKDDVDTQLRTLDGWALVENAIQKQFRFVGFPQAVAFVASLVADCESDDHHPDVAINYRRVTLTWTTHSEGGVTSKDIDGARMAERHFRVQQPR
jgi:4a-hydroxytetrahydrobiopterin dehydratase